MSTETTQSSNIKDQKAETPIFIAEASAREMRALADGRMMLSDKDLINAEKVLGDCDSPI